MAKVIAYRLEFNLKAKKGRIGLKVAGVSKALWLGPLSPEQMAGIGTVLRSDATVELDGTILSCGDKIE